MAQPLHEQRALLDVAINMRFHICITKPLDLWHLLSRICVSGQRPAVKVIKRSHTHMSAILHRRATLVFTMLSLGRSVGSCCAPFECTNEFHTFCTAWGLVVSSELAGRVDGGCELGAVWGWLLWAGVWFGLQPDLGWELVGVMDVPACT